MRNAIIIRDLHRGIAVNPEREDLFRNTFLQYLKQLGLRLPAVGSPEQLHQLIKIVFEAVGNVYDHADRKPLNYRPERTHQIDSLLRFGYDGDHLHLLVQDSGVGIAARQAQSLAVYDGPLESELDVLQEALRSRGSAKLRAQDCSCRGVPGYGFTYITAYLKELGVTASLRTGRLLGNFDRDRGEFRFVPLPERAAGTALALTWKL